jgi:hypothetical protein
LEWHDLAECGSAPVLLELQPSPSQVPEQSPVEVQSNAKADAGKNAHSARVEDDSEANQPSQKAQTLGEGRLSSQESLWDPAQTTAKQTAQPTAQPTAQKTAQEPTQQPTERSAPTQLPTQLPAQQAVQEAVQQQIQQADHQVMHQLLQQSARETLNGQLPLGDAPFPPDVHETPGVEEGSHTTEQDLALFDLTITYHEHGQKLALLALNRARVQFRVDNEKAVEAARKARRE